MAEFALVLPLLLFLFLGMVEVGNALTVAHTLSKLSREGANIASRGTSLDTVLTVVATSGRDIQCLRPGPVQRAPSNGTSTWWPLLPA